MRRFPAWPLGVALLLLLLVGEWVPGGEPAVQAVAPPRVARGPQAQTRMAARDIEGWAGTILARPLFSVSRKPPKPAAVHSAGAQEGLPRLSGIMIFAGVKRAIFAPDGGGKPLVLAEGASLADTSIRLIQPGEVVLTSGEVLRPTYDKNRVSTPLPDFTATDGVRRPGFAGPGFPAPGFPNPGFQPAGMPGAPAFPGGFPAMPQPGPQPGPQSDTNDAIPSPPPFRGLPQQRRE